MVIVLNTLLDRLRTGEEPNGTTPIKGLYSQCGQTVGFPNTSSRGFSGVGSEQIQTPLPSSLKRLYSSSQTRGSLLWIQTSRSRTRTQARGVGVQISRLALLSLGSGSTD